MTDKGPRCPEHRIERTRRYEQHERPERDLTVAFYKGKEWQAARRAVLDAEPLCRDCRQRDGRMVPATDVDHVVPFRAGGAALDPSNLRPLCKGCHSRYTLAATRASGGLGTWGRAR